jgi:2-polyprenyl-6-methoxyphenol hydroxylase-like FAD-dependent oxidoreductase
MKTILISGAGVAGPTLAFWLARAGFRATVVERASGQRSSGNPVDVRGPGLPVAEAMGVVPRLREAATGVTAARLIDARGRRGARVAMRSGRSAAGTAEIEIPRADLATILYESAQHDAEFIFDDTITTMEDGPDGVEVTFERTPSRLFDLVVGADGLHSTVRRLAFGPESDYVRHLGVYVGTLPLDEPADDPSEVLLYNSPGRLIGVHPARGRALLAFIFRGAAISGFDHRDATLHRRVLLEAYGKDRAWLVPQFLDRVRQADDLYFDGVSRVDLPSWSRGRVTLLGDAAASVSLFGDGSSLAMAGARALAEALASTGDVGLALRRYEAGHRRHTDAKGRTAGLAATLLIPRTRPGIVTRNAAARLLSGALAR